MITRIRNLAIDAIAKNEPRAIEAFAWYERGCEFCHSIDRDNSIPAGTTAGVVAALSPLNHWQTQVDYTPGIISRACHLIHAGRNPHGAITLSFFRNKDKAARILQGEAPLSVLGGDKVRSFFANLTGDDDAVTIDRHAIDISGFSSKSADVGKLTAGAYARIAFAFRAAAHDLGLTPCGIQALTWCYWRELKGGREW
jgi:hypothetical protein